MEGFLRFRGMRSTCSSAAVLLLFCLRCCFVLAGIMMMRYKTYVLMKILAGTSSIRRVLRIIYLPKYSRNSRDISMYASYLEPTTRCREPYKATQGISILKFKPNSNCCVLTLSPKSLDHLSLPCKSLAPSHRIPKTQMSKESLNIVQSLHPVRPPLPLQ